MDVPMKIHSFAKGSSQARGGYAQTNCEMWGSSLRAAHSLIFRPTRPGLLLRTPCAAVEERLGPRQWWAFSPSFGVRLPQLLRHLFAVLLDPIRRAVLRDTAPGTAAR